MIRAILLTFAALTNRQTDLALIPAPPGQHQFGNVVYTLPDSWIAGRNSDGGQVICCDLPQDLFDYCYSYISAGFPAARRPLGAC